MVHGCVLLILMVTLILLSYPIIFNNMTPKLKEQKELMEKALSICKDKEVISRLISPVDPITAKVMLSDLNNDYIEVMQKLFTNLLETLNVIQQ